MKRLFVLALSLTGLKQEIFAQPGLDTVTIANSYIQQPVQSTGRNIIIIKGEQFSRQPVHSIDELLRYVPGVEVQQRGIAGSQSDIVLRGGTFQQVLVVLDGIRLNDPNTGHFSSYIPIAPAEIERIEILKGASSSIYGSEAVGGVIHIITKSFAARGKVKEVTAQASAGSFGMLNANIGGTYSNGKTTVSAGFLNSQANGEPQRGLTGFFNNNTVSASISHRFGNGVHVSFRTACDDRSFAAQNFYTSFLSDTAVEDVHTFWNQLKIGYEIGNSRLSLHAGYKKVNDEFDFSPRSIANNNRSKLWQLFALYEIDLSQVESFVTGAQFQSKEIRSNDRGDHQLDQLAQFLSYTRRFKAFSMNPSIRFDYMQDNNIEVVPQLNLSYLLNKFQFRASGGKTIRDADFTERYNNYNKPVVTSGRIGDPGLDAERSWSYEAGADYFLSNHLKIAASLFQRHHRNLVDWTPTPYSQMPRKDNLVPAGTYALARNIAKVRTTGAELDIQYSRSLAKEQDVFATLGMVWLESKTSDAVPSFYISSHAKFLVNFNLQYTLKRLSFSVNGVYKHRNPQMAAGMKTIPSDCLMANAKAEVRLFSNFFIFGEVDNVGDESCSDLLGAQLPGRWYSGGVKLSIR